MRAEPIESTLSTCAVRTLAGGPGVSTTRSRGAASPAGPGPRTVTCTRRAHEGAKVKQPHDIKAETDVRRETQYS